jgi:adenylosuccinate synthase
MMKLDVLNSFKEIKVCTHYKMDDQILDILPFEIGEKTLEPVYRSFEGWEADLSGVRSLSEMPLQVRRYIEFLEEDLQIPISIVSIGPDRAQTILKENVAV